MPYSTRPWHDVDILDTFAMYSRDPTSAQGHEHYLPMVTYVTLLGVWLNPLHVMHRSSRYWLLRILARVVVAPLVAVNFADFWLADQVYHVVLSNLSEPFW